MTDNLLQKLEEKIMSLLTEVDGLRKELSRLKVENSSLSGAHVNYSKKLQELVSLLDMVEVEQVGSVGDVVSA